MSLLFNVDWSCVASVSFPEDGHDQVAFVTFASRDRCVVKGSDFPAQELFANLVLQAIGLAVPPNRLISTKLELQRICKAIEEAEGGRHLRALARSSYVLLQEFIPCSRNLKDQEAWNWFKLQCTASKRDFSTTMRYLECKMPSYTAI